ncbi:MAG: putative type restriction enzymeP protein [Bacillales bacterium]|nr:putative type restriction enzymeP protein [Bacillales bacterium]
MERKEFEQVFDVLTELSQIISEDLMLNEIDSLIEAANFWFSNDVFDTMLSESAVYRMEKIIKDTPLSQFDADMKFEGFKFALLKVMKKHVTPNHQMTPDVVTVLVNYLAEKLLKGKADLNVLDPTVGTGHLLLEFLRKFADRTAFALGTDIDEMMLDIAEINAVYGEIQIEFDNVDAAEEVGSQKFDVVLSDLPDATKKTEGKPKLISIVDNAIAQTSVGGYLFLVVPESLVNGVYAGDMVRILKESAYLLALIKLPKSMFVNEDLSKNIVVLQKKGANVVAPKESLLAQLPSVSNKEAIADMMLKIDSFFEGK